MCDLVEGLRKGVWGRARRADAAIQALMQDGADRIEAQAARIAELEEIVKSAFTEGFDYGHEEGKELGEFAGNGGDHRRYQYARDSIWYWERSETETALKGGKEE